MPIRIDDAIVIADDELQFTATRSGGAGGQNVNKVNSRVQLRFDLEHCSAFTPEQKARIREKLATRIDRDGAVRVVAQRHRSQAMNREAAAQRLAELLREALLEDAPRFATRPSRASVERRITEKSRRGALKRDRASGRDDD